MTSSRGPNMNRNSDFYRFPRLMAADSDKLKQALSQRAAGNGKVAIFDAIKPLLNGAHSVADIYAKLAIADFEVQAVSQALEVLDELGFLGEAPAIDTGTLTEEELRRHKSQIELFDDWLGEDPAVRGPQTKGHQAQVNLRDARVILVGLERAGSRLAKTLTATGVGEICGIGAPKTGNGSARLDASETLADAIAMINPSVRFTEVQQSQDLPSPLENGAVSLLVYCPDEFDQPLCIQLNDLALGASVPFLIYR